MSVVTFTVRVRLLDFGGQPRDGVKVLAAPIPAVKKTANAVHGTDPEDSVTNDTGLAILTLISIPGLWYRISGKGFDAVRFAAYFPDPSDPTTGTAFPQDYEIDFEDLVDESPTPGYEAIAFLAPGGYVLPAELDALDARVVVLEEAPGGGGGGAVDSVNGETGVVVLDAADVGAATAAQGTKADTAVQPADLTAYATDADLSGHAADTTAVHGIADTAALVLTSDARLSDARTPTTHTHPLADVTDAGDSAGLDIGTTAGTVAAGDDSRITGAAQKSANLSDLANAATARTNLGLGTAATTAATAYATAAQGTLADSALAASAAPELIRDTMAAALVAGSNVTITPNDGADTITIAASGGGGGGGVSADPGNTATLGTDNLIYVPKAIGIEPGDSQLLEPGPNRFNSATVTLEYRVDHTTGALTAAAGWWASDFIPVAASSPYWTKVSWYRAYYDDSQTFISGVNVGSITGGTTFTTPAGAAYVRDSHFEQSRIATQVVAEGSTARPWTAYQLQVPPEILREVTPSVLVTDAATGATLGDALASLAVVAGPPANAFNPATVTDGFYFNTTTGVMTAGADWHTSDFIPVTAGTVYAGNLVWWIAWFTRAQVFISGSNLTPQGAKTFTAPAGAVYARFSWFGATVPSTIVFRTARPRSCRPSPTPRHPWTPHSSSTPPPSTCPPPSPPSSGPKRTSTSTASSPATTRRSTSTSRARSAPSSPTGGPSPRRGRHLRAHGRPVPRRRRGGPRNDQRHRQGRRRGNRRH
jgi:hypothetical protein